MATLGNGGNSRAVRKITSVLRPALIIAVLAAAALAGCSAPGSASKSNGNVARASAKTAEQGGARAAHGAQAPGDPGRGGFGHRGPIAVQAATAKSGTLTASRVATGSVVPVTKSEVAAQVSGVVSQVFHQAGDWVTAGDTVVKLDDSQLKLAVDNANVALKNAQINLDVGRQNAAQDNPKLTLQLQSAEAALASAQKNYTATEELFKAGGASSSAVDTAQSQLQTAQANVQAGKIALTQNQQADTQNIAQLELSVEQARNQLRQANLNLQNANITAPFSGQIAAVNVTRGEFVGQNTSAFLLVSADREVSFSVPPTDAPALTPGHEVTFTVSGTNYTARVDQSPSAPISGSVPLVARFLSGEQSLPYGAVGNVSYPVTLARGTLVPISSIQTVGSQTYVFTIVAGKSHRQPVDILAETADTAAVSELSASSRVIVSPPPGLLVGADVTAVGSSGGTK